MFYVGLDLGKQTDPSALAVIERPDWYWGCGRAESEFPGLTVRHLERVPLGIKYPAVVERVREVVSDEELRGRCGVALDATGVGAPVVDMLRAAQLGCEIAAVTITGGDREVRHGGSGWCVPKRDLMAGVQVGLEQGEATIARELREAGALVEELMDTRVVVRSGGRVRMGADGRGEHDDLVIAVALGVWMARRPGWKKKNSWTGGGRLF